MDVHGVVLVPGMLAEGQAVEALRKRKRTLHAVHAAVQRWFPLVLARVFFIRLYPLKHVQVIGDAYDDGQLC